MGVLVLTIFISLILAVFFIGMFYLQSTGGRAGGSVERDSLLPFDDDTPCVKPSVASNCESPEEARDTTDQS
jgi:hypothetical protein